MAHCPAVAETRGGRACAYGGGSAATRGAGGGGGFRAFYGGGGSPSGGSGGGRFAGNLKNAHVPRVVFRKIVYRENGAHVTRGARRPPARNRRPEVCAAERATGF